MRFLCAALPEAGQVTPALPVVRSLVDSGHEVTVTTGPDFAAAVAGAGARFLPLPEGAGGAGLPRPGEPAGLRRLRAELVDACAPATAQTRHLLALHAADPADAVLADAAFLGARYVRELGGPPVAYYRTSVLPHASRHVPPLGPARPAGPVGWARDAVRWAAVTRATAAALDGQRRALGLPPARRTVLDWPPDAGLLLQLSPAGFEHPRGDLPATLHFVGTPAPLPTPAWAPPPWWADLRARRLVVVTGTGALLPAALAGLADLDVLVVAGSGGADPATVGPLPANARAGGHVPFGVLLPHAAAVVADGGFGDVQLAIGHGVPLVVAGAAGGAAEVAARVARSGTGIDLGTGTPDPEAVRAAVQRVLHDPSYAVRARALAATAPPADAAARAAALLAVLAATGRPVIRTPTRRPALPSGQAPSAVTSAPPTEKFRAD